MKTRRKKRKEKSPRGRPPGSKDTRKRKVRGSRKRKGKLVPLRDVTPDQLAHALNTMTDLVESVESWKGHTASLMRHLQDRMAGMETSLHRLVEDTEHPTTQLLARRLINIETSERLSLNAKERLDRLEFDLNALRKDLGELIAERHAERNMRELRKIANEDEEDHHHGHN